MNELATSNSLYLRQHANNPVHWKLWNENRFTQNSNTAPLRIISIGYSSCHWCHVMEEESFEDHEVAALMNEHFVSIKVDRERHPEVDARYMNALQLMTGTGGWPLNIIALPDGTPIYGGTYFSKEDWMQALRSVHSIWMEDPERVLSYGQEMKQGLVHMIQVSLSTDAHSFSAKDFEDVVAFWKRTIDPVNGGPNGAPKFPMPSNYRFLLNYAIHSKDEDLLGYCRLTLEKMALGGIFDWLHGGMTRYSTDRFWKVPHFEKMLYDNAQLMSLYARAARYFEDSLFLETAEKIGQFLVEQMLLDNGLYASALDADSAKGEEARVEGGFYTWTKEELDQLPIEHRELFNAYFDINEHSTWEGAYILHRSEVLSTLMEKMGLNPASAQIVEQGWRKVLKKASEQRLTTHPLPQRDEKALTSWNALLVEGWYELHLAAPANGYERRAIELIRAIQQNMVKDDGILLHEYKGHSGYLDDYATFGKALLKGFALSGDEGYVQTAASLAEQIDRLFGHDEFAPFYDYSTQLAADWQHVLEIEDNVIPSANSITASFFHELSLVSGNSSWAEKGTMMTERIHAKVFKHGQNFSNWLELALHYVWPIREIVVIGPEASAKMGALTRSQYVPGSLHLISRKSGELPLTKFREPTETSIYVCQQGACKLPTTSIEQAIAEWTS